MNSEIAPSTSTQSQRKQRRQTATLIAKVTSRKVADMSARVFGEWVPQPETDEFEDFIQNAPVQVDSAIEWWCQEAQQQRWPRLSQLAISVFSIPAMSDEPERVFSGARRTISWERSRLGPKMIEILECSKHYYKSQEGEAGRKS
jgi:hypothetical protein